MAHFVAKELHMRPSDILDKWGVPELLVAYGEYANRIAAQNYDSWERHYILNQEGTPAPPAKYIVRFVSVAEAEELLNE